MTILQWEKTPHTTSTSYVSDFNNGVYRGRYMVRRVAPHARKFVALRDGKYFARTQYDTLEGAKGACEADADNPKSVVIGKANAALEYA